MVWRKKRCPRPIHLALASTCSGSQIRHRGSRHIRRNRRTACSTMFPTYFVIAPGLALVELHSRIKENQGGAAAPALPIQARLNRDGGLDRRMRIVAGQLKILEFKVVNVFDSGIQF